MTTTNTNRPAKAPPINGMIGDRIWPNPVLPKLLWPVDVVVPGIGAIVGIIGPETKTKTIYYCGSPFFNSEFDYQIKQIKTLGLIIFEQYSSLPLFVKVILAILSSNLSKEFLYHERTDGTVVFSKYTRFPHLYNWQP